VCGRQHKGGGRLVDELVADRLVERCIDQNDRRSPLTLSPIRDSQSSPNRKVPSRSACVPDLNSHFVPAS
jgi:hypothetical protein